MANKINFIPKPKHFLVEAEGAKETPQGIIIPDSAKDMVGEVLFSTPQKVACVGADDKEYTYFVKEGDWVLLEPSPVDLIEVEGKGYFLIADYRVRGKVLNYVPKEKTTKSSIII